MRVPKTIGLLKHVADKAGQLCKIMFRGNAAMAMNGYAMVTVEWPGEPGTGESHVIDATELAKQCNGRDRFVDVAGAEPGRIPGTMVDCQPGKLYQFNPRNLEAVLKVLNGFAKPEHAYLSICHGVLKVYSQTSAGYKVFAMVSLGEYGPDQAPEVWAPNTYKMFDG